MAELNNLTKEYLLKIAPDISVFEIFDMYDAKPNISFDKTYFEKDTDNKKFKRALYRIEPDNNFNIATDIKSTNAFFHSFEVDDIVYVIAICEKDDEYIVLTISNANSICKVGF